MKKLLALTFFFVFTFSSVLQAKGVTKSFEIGVRATIGSMMNVQGGSATVSEFVTFTVAEPYLEWRPLSSLGWLGLEVSGYVGNTGPYNLGEVKEATMPTVTLKGHKTFSWADIYFGLGGQLTSVSGSYEYVSGATKTKYPAIGGGVGGVVQAGLSFPLFVEGLSLGLDVKYTPMSTFSVEFSKTDKAVISKMLTPAFGLSYLF